MPDRVVYYTYESSSLSNLPQLELRVVPAGLATNGHDDGDAATTSATWPSPCRPMPT